MTARDEPPVASARVVVLVRYRPSHTEDTTADPGHAVHLIALPLGGDGAEVRGLCGVRMPVAQIETVTPGDSSCCTLCFVGHVTDSSPAPDPTPTSTPAGRRSMVAGYRKLGWPLILRGVDVSLALDPLNAVALVLPVLVGTEVTEILARRRCAPAVLSHPALPAHRIILATDPYPVALGWPPGVHQLTGTLPLPPTTTAYGPVCWVRPPEPNTLRLCREFDVFAALHTALRQ